MTGAPVTEAQALIAALDGHGITRLVALFDHRREDGGAKIGGYQLYVPWDHGDGGNLYIDAHHEFETGPVAGRVPKCVHCGEGPRDGDHYGLNPDVPAVSPEPEIVAAATALLAARFAGSESAAGVLKVDTESSRVWCDLHYEVVGNESGPTLTVEL